MRNKNVIFIIIGIIILIGTVLGVLYHFRDRRTYELNIPQAENLQSISLAKEAQGKSYIDVQTIKDIWDVIVGVKRITKEESIQDYPINAEDIIKVEFNSKEKGSSVLFVYKKNNKYYIEQPYNGIHAISKDEYKSIEKYI